MQYFGPPKAARPTNDDDGDDADDDDDDALRLRQRLMAQHFGLAGADRQSD